MEHTMRLFGAQHGSRTAKHWKRWRVNGSDKEPGVMRSEGDTLWVETSAPIPGNPGHNDTAIMDTRVPMTLEGLGFHIDHYLKHAAPETLELLSRKMHMHHKQQREAAEREREQMSEVVVAA